MARARNSYLFVEDQIYNVPRWRISGDTVEFHPTKDDGAKEFSDVCRFMHEYIRASLRGRILNVGSLRVYVCALAEKGYYANDPRKD